MQCLGVAHGIACRRHVPRREGFCSKHRHQAFLMSAELASLVTRADSPNELTTASRAVRLHLHQKLRKNRRAGFLDRKLLLALADAVGSAPMCEIVAAQAPGALPATGASPATGSSS